MGWTVVEIDGTFSAGEGGMGRSCCGARLWRPQTEVLVLTSCEIWTLYLPQTLRGVCSRIGSEPSHPLYQGIALCSRRFAFALSASRTPEESSLLRHDHSRNDIQIISCENAQEIPISLASEQGH